VGLVDFDMAGPTTRLVDVYNTAMHWVPLRDPVDIGSTWTGLDQPGRLRVLADAYGLTESQWHRWESRTGPVARRPTA